ncbi:MAG: LysE family transporter [Alphaproteobacteria bacterium]|uniref:LysE family translocator n=1 Tax=Aestuariivirga sp. TaxID=2650926 RepID=UPI003017A116|nr:LysE family transporter [Alphaproteobacteria bacterium]
MDLTLLLTGIAIGLAVTAPLGPVNILVIRNAIRRGFTVAFLVGLGAVAADVLYASAAAYGVSWVSSLIAAYARPLMLVGGLLLVVTGVWLARKRVEISAIAGDEPQTAKVIGKSLAAFGLTVTNPGEFFGFIAIFGTMSGILRLHEDWARPPTVIAGVAIGGSLWWLCLSFLVSRLKTRISERALARISRWTGILIAAFGFALLMEAVG